MVKALHKILGEFGNLNALSKAVETTEAPSLHTFADAGGNVVARLTAAGDFQPQDVVTDSGSFNTIAKKYLNMKFKMLYQLKQM